MAATYRPAGQQRTHEGAADLAIDLLAAETRNAATLLRLRDILGMPDAEMDYLLDACAAREARVRECSRWFPAHLDRRGAGRRR